MSLSLHLESDLTLLTWLCESTASVADSDIFSQASNSIPRLSGYSLLSPGTSTRSPEVAPVQPWAGTCFRVSSQLLASEHGGLPTLLLWTSVPFSHSIPPCWLPSIPSLWMSLHLHSFIRLPLLHSGDTLFSSLCPQPACSMRRAGTMFIVVSLEQYVTSCLTHTVSL